MKLRIYTLWVQGIYTLLTGIWPIIDIESFMEVSGYKTDVWLVKTVAVLLVPMAITFLLSTNDKDLNLPVSILAVTSAIGLAFIDVYYTSTDTIWSIYLADAAMQILFIVAWLVVLLRNK